MDNRISLEREFGIRLVDDEPGLFTGYASVFGVLDAYGTVFDKGAFKKTIKEHKGRLPVVWMHRIDEPVGLAYVEEDGHGFLVKEGRLNLDIQKGQEVYSGMKFREGYITQMSHTFSGVKTTTVKGDDDEDIIHFKEVKSFEISPVTTNFAANEEAVITSVRTEDLDTDGIKARIAEYYKKLGETPPWERIIIPERMSFQMGRLSALLRKPPIGTFAAEPRRKPDGHLRECQEQIARMERVLIRR